MKKATATLLIFSALMARMLLASTTGTLSGDGTVLTVDIASDDTFDASLLTSSVTDFVKQGAGTLTVESDLSAYQGRIAVSNGVYRSTLPAAVGDVTSGKGGAVEVSDGATLEFVGGAVSPFTMPKKQFIIGGTGVDGRGAVVYSGAAVFSKASFGNNITLRSDVTVSCESDIHVYWNNSPTYLYLQGHTLTFNPYSGKSFILAYINTTDPQNGKIAMAGNTLSLMNGGMAMDGNGQFDISNSATFELSQLSGTVNWSVNLADGCELRARSNVTEDQVLTNLNAVSGPLVIGNASTVMPLKFGYTQPINAVNLKGKVSGGGFSLVRDERVTSAQFHLYNAENDFAGGVTAASGIDVYLWNPGALPADGGDLSLNAGSLYLKSAGYYELPGASFADACAVSGGAGCWSGTVTKTGVGDLDYQSAVDGETLVVNGGTVRFAVQREKIAGLYEGQYAYAKNTSPDYESYFKGKNFTTNSIAHGTMCSYDSSYSLWTFPDVAGSNTRGVICYKGYLWNNSSEPVTWAFAGSEANTTHLEIGGTVVYEQLYNVSGTKYIGHGTATLQPGANSFLYVVYAGGLTGNGPNSWFSDGSAAAQGNWKANFGLAVNKSGVDSLAVADYEPLVDPGDGSVYTYALPGDASVVRPEVSEPLVLDNGMLPTFTAMQFAAGSGIDFGDADKYVLADLSGMPQIANCDELNLTNSWAVDAAEFQHDGSVKLTTAGKLVLASGLKFDLDSAASFKSAATDNRYCIATATQGIELGEVTVTSDRDSMVFKLELSQDEKSLYLVKEVAGMILFIQ